MATLQSRLKFRWILTALIVLVAIIGAIPLLTKKPPVAPQDNGDKMRIQVATDLEKSFADQGLVIKCSVDPSRRALLLNGAAVDRVFAGHFLQTASTIRMLKNAGFVSVSFWNGKSGAENGDVFMRDDPLPN